MHQGRGHGGVDATGQGAHHLPVSNLCTNAANALLNEVAGSPCAPAPADVVQEVLYDLLALRCVHHLRVKLEANHPFIVAHNGYRRVVGVCQGAEARRHLQHLVSVAHPYGCRRGQICEDEAVRSALVQDCVAVLSPVPRNYLAAKLVRQDLQAVAYPQDREASFVDPHWGHGRIRLVNARGASGQDDAFGVEMRHLVPGSVVGDYLAVDPGLADATGYEATVLGAEVHHHHRFVPGFVRVLRNGSQPSSLPRRSPDRWKPLRRRWLLFAEWWGRYFLRPFSPELMRR